MCECMKSLNNDLAAHNCKLAVGFAVTASGGMDVFPILATEKIVPRGKRPPILTATYCPFCGEKYPERQFKAA